MNAPHHLWCGAFFCKVQLSIFREFSNLFIVKMLKIA